MQYPTKWVLSVHSIGAGLECWHPIEVKKCEEHDMFFLNADLHTEVFHSAN